MKMSMSRTRRQPKKKNSCILFMVLALATTNPQIIK
jgi:hypothetical protein